MNTHTSVKVVPCSACSRTVVAADFVVCGACATPMHRSCSWEVATCLVPECRGGDFREPAEMLFGDARRPSPPPRARPADDLISTLEAATRPSRTRIRVLMGVYTVLSMTWILSTTARIWAGLAAGSPAAAGAVAQFSFYLWIAVSLIGALWCRDDLQLLRAVDRRLEELRTERLVTRAAGDDEPGGQA